MAVEEVSEEDLLLFLKQNGSVVIGCTATKTKGTWHYRWVAEMQRGHRVVKEISPDFVKRLQEHGLITTQMTMHMNCGRQHLANYRVDLAAKGEEKLRLKVVGGGG